MSDLHAVMHEMWEWEEEEKEEMAHSERTLNRVGVIRTSSTASATFSISFDPWGAVNRTYLDTILQDANSGMGNNPGAMILGSLGMKNAAGAEDGMEALRRMADQPSGVIDEARIRAERIRVIQQRGEIEERRLRAMQKVQGGAENERNIYQNNIRRDRESQRIADQNAYNRALGLRSEHEMAAKVEKQDDGKTFVVDVEASKKAALDLIQQIVTGIPKEMENKAEVRQLKKRVKLLEGQIVRGAAVGQQPEIGTRSIDMDDDE